MITEAQKVELEMLLDRSSLYAVVTALAEIAHEKAEHIRSTYQDRPTAGVWNRAGNVIEVCAGALSKIGI